MLDRARKDAYDATRPWADKSVRAACYAPFVSLYFNTAGNAVACCRNQSFVLGNVARDSLDEIWHGPRIRAMRQGFVDYEFGPGCEFCEWLVTNGDHQGAMTRHFDWMAVEAAEPAFPKQMEFAMGNDCNFACVQCTGEWSSRIRTQREGLPPLARPYGDRFFTDLERYLPHLERAKFFGGEPFLIPENQRVWDLMDKLGARPDSYILTNGSIWNEKVEHVLATLRPAISVSLDAIADPALLESIRVGAKHATVLGNIQRFGAYTRSAGRQLAISFTLMVLNWRELAPVLQFCEENDFAVDVIRLVDPRHLSLFAQPAATMREIAAEMQRIGQTVRPGLRRHGATWDNVVQSLLAAAERPDDYDRVQEGMRTARSTHPVQVASQAMARQDWNAVLSAAQDTPPTDRDYVHALVLMGHAHRQLGQLPMAEAVLDEAAKLTKRLPSVYVERTWLRLAQQRPADAFAEADLAIAAARGPEQSHWAFRGAVEACVRLRDLERLRSYADRFQQSEPASHEVALELARALQRCGDRVAALRCLDRVVAPAEPTPAQATAAAAGAALRVELAPAGDQAADAAAGTS
ncbi:MAG: SPASM domain-containing protein [Planctomycetota bacterium]|jgi:MoaA/NifB/PqqE/SkfB family radical SAM enzyme/Tfp pilus assembly protein PilF